MTSEEIALAVNELFMAAHDGDYSVSGEEKVAAKLRDILSQAYEEAERAVHDGHCRCNVPYLSGREHHADCPIRSVRALKDSLAQEPAASAL